MTAVERIKNKWKWRRRAARMIAQGKTTRGTARIVVLHPEMHRLASTRQYARAWARRRAMATRPRFSGKLNGLAGTARNTALARLYRAANRALGLTSRGQARKRERDCPRCKCQLVGKQCPVCTATAQIKKIYRRRQYQLKRAA
jgi:hypothetical protein